MISVKENINKLKISPSIINKLKSNNLNKIDDLWSLKRKDLKESGFNDSEIKSIIISLQLEGLDLNKKIYD